MAEHAEDHTTAILILLLAAFVVIMGYIFSFIPTSSIEIELKPAIQSVPTPDFDIPIQEARLMPTLDKNDKLC